MKTLPVVVSVFCCITASFGWSVDSVSVDSVWNSDSSWYDTDGLLQQRTARDCIISFIPQGTGDVSCSLAVSLDGGTTWGAIPDPLRIIDNSQEVTFPCGKKACIKARVFGADRQNVVFKVIARNCVPVFFEDFENGLNKWYPTYMVVVGQRYYPQMRITTDAAHSQTHSLTADSNRTALLYALDVTARIEHGIAGVGFYLMTKEKGGINFTVALGKTGGSSGGLSKAFGIGFDPNDSIKCSNYDMLSIEPVADSMIAPIELNHWYQCAVEVDFTTKKVTYIIDDVTVRSQDLPTSNMGSIDRLLVLRGTKVDRPHYDSVSCKEGVKRYYVDDITLYTK